ncbi:MAG: SUMF1/EgtB/PvdO family nonheme iron enzyme [Deltaproteobacteria bacterium]|nr:SUMF1/EgtB/PvdO family nonheme iron enzyme [Deltaproteobacteria bacterium]
MWSLLWGLGVGAVALGAEWPDVTAGLPQTAEGAGDAAVIVGLSDYVFAPDVPGALENASDWRRYLASRGVPLASIHLLANGAATREAMLDEAEWAAERVRPGGRVWFVYIGHGAPSEDGRDGVFVGADTQGTARSLYARGVRQGELQSILSAGPQADTVMLLDACFSGKTSAEGTLVRGLQPLIPTAATATGGALVLSAGRSDQFAGPLPGLDRPAFSYLALGALTGWGDADGDGEVTAGEAVDYASGALSVLVTDRVQQPQLSGGARARVLGGGSRGGPDLLAMAESLQGRGPAESVVTLDQHPSDLGDLEARIREQRCRAAASAEVVRQRDAGVGAAVAAREAALTAEWIRLRAVASECGRLEDGDLRGSCRAEVLGFRERLTGEEVRVSASALEVATACGRRHGLAEGAEVPVGEGVREEVDRFLSRYREGSWWVDEPGDMAGADGRQLQSPVLGTLRWIPAGIFEMGSPEGEAGRDDDEDQHEVRLRAGYWMMESEVTQRMWTEVMGSSPAYFTTCGTECPVETVSWEDAAAFARRVSAREGVPYRLPTEAEWEYAARGGEDHRYAGDGELAAVGWVGSGSAGTTHRVCTKRRNGYGLCDMSGNVWEWVIDWEGYYGDDLVTDPEGPAAGTRRVYRGGGWNDDPRKARVAHRGSGPPGDRDIDLGFRLVRTSN